MLSIVAIINNKSLLLEELSVSYNKLQTLTTLSGLTSLRSLVASNNLIATLPVLSTLTALTILDLRHNQLTENVFMEPLSEDRSSLASSGGRGRRKNRGRLPPLRMNMSHNAFKNSLLCTLTIIATYFAAAVVCVVCFAAAAAGSHDTMLLWCNCREALVLLVLFLMLLLHSFTPRLLHSSTSRLLASLTPCILASLHPRLLASSPPCILASLLHRLFNISPNHLIDSNKTVEVNA
ncbi:Leucine-rich repeat domain L domain-like [Trinorchestia longiramus]|nr:Leucine-rich repeat domain L domain-like [Trinorchestia longiramus]